MKSTPFRWMMLGLALGLTAAVMPSCTKKCDSSNCKGCCTDKNECLQGDGAAACGTAGAKCSACGEGEECAASICSAIAVVDAGADAGMVDAGPPPCVRDDDCASQKNGTVCDISTGQCIPGQGCSSSAECQTDDETSPCYRYGRQCYCDVRDAPDSGLAYSGTCRRRMSPCEECTSNSQCGDEIGIFDPPEGQGRGKCSALAGDTSNKKFCLYQQVGQCGCGTINDGTGYCKPQSNSCSQVGCNIDKDCPSGAVCSVNNPDAGTNSCGGICEPRCRWDFATKELVAPGCPPDKPACWVDSKNLDPRSIAFGSGRCRPACSSNTDCAASTSNPFGGTNLACRAEALNGGGTSVKRCRGAGECMDTLECPERPNDQPYLGYCDRDSLSCKADCRTGADPVTALPYKDCRNPFACSAPDSGVGPRVCRLLNCVEQGGAAIACSRGQYCCGEDKNQNGQPDPCPPRSEQDDVGCYSSPIPPFCQTCMSQDDCKTLQVPNWMSGANACANGSKNPICSLMPARCLYAGDKGMAMGVNVCMIGTVNDTRSVPSRARVGCPNGYDVTDLVYGWEKNTDNYCETNDDCQIGNDAGVCEPDPTLRLKDGGVRKACRCNAGNNSACPIDLDAGIRSECRGTIPGTRTYCLDSVVCVPKARDVYNVPDASIANAGANYGCGL